MAPFLNVQGQAKEENGRSTTNPTEMIRKSGENHKMNDVSGEEAPTIFKWARLGGSPDPEDETLPMLKEESAEPEVEMISKAEHLRVVKQLKRELTSASAKAKIGETTLAELKQELKTAKSKIIETKNGRDFALQQGRRIYRLILNLLDSYRLANMNMRGSGEQRDSVKQEMLAALTMAVASLRQLKAGFLHRPVFYDVLFGADSRTLANEGSFANDIMETEMR